MAKTTGHKRIATAQRDKRKSVYGRSSVNNAKIAALLRQYAAVLSVQGESRFKVKAFRRAAETVESTIENLAEQVAQGADLRELPAIGSGIAAVIQEIVQSGGLPKLDQAMEQLPPELLELATKPQLNPQKILRVYKKFGIRSLNQLTKRLDSGEIGKAFGTRLEFQLRHALDSRPRHLLWAVQKLTPAIEAYLREHCGVDRLEPVGSLRRRQDTVADIGYLVTGTSAPQIFKRFANFGAVEAPAKVKGRRASFQLAGNRTVTLVYSQTADWGLNLLLETGSGSHLKELQSQAAKSKLSLAKRSLGKKAVDEATIYGGLGLDFVPPELREGRGEVQAALERALPQLITLEDLKGDLHMHTTASDGANSIEEMATAAAARGYQYIAITDHSQSLKITNGLNEKRLVEQIKAIDRVNARLQGFTVLKSSEVDILEDGRLDYPNTLLRQLDLTICSIHSKFSLERQKQTERILRAMDNPHFNILGHATGRLLLQREGYDIDVERLIEHAKQRGCFFEINGNPNRLDLSAEHAHMTKNAGVKIAINTDAHSVAELRFITAGLNQARRGWLEASDVLNAMPLRQLQTLLRR